MPILNRHLVATHSRWLTTGDAVDDRLGRYADRASERGDVTPRTIMVFVFASIAITVGAIIKAKVEGKANAIVVD